MPDKIDDNLISISDSKWCLNDTESLPSPVQTSAIADAEVDIRPRFFDNLTNQWMLVDTGAQVSCVPPSPGDQVDPSLRCEAVDGSLLPCYGKKMLTFRIGRKTYHQPVMITNTTETILGIDFIIV